MKKIALIIFSVLIFVSCGPGKIAQEARKTIDGEWTLTSITSPGNENNLDVLLFNDATASCLENSSWSFVSNNNTGYYTVSDMQQCNNTEKRYFKWSINAVNADTGNFDFMLKPTDANWDSATDAGFRINLLTVTETNMVWEQTVNFEGSPFTIQMNFNKN